MADAGLTPLIVVFDGDCAFCRGQAARIERWDTRRRFELIPRQRPGLTDRFPQLAEGDFNTGMRLLMPDGRIHVGADAAFEIGRRLPYWRRIAWLYRVPGLHLAARAAYAWIAAHRQSLGRTCRDDACRVGKKAGANDPQPH